MREASKTNQYRDPAFFDQYLSGNILDIGAGNDLVCNNAVSFDVSDGDANFLDRYFSPESFDTVHSSHCLEHMINPREALTAWWSLVKPGGYLILVVPDEDLYEQGIWPSAFNHDHKHTFRINKPNSWSPVSYDVLDLCENLPHSEIISANLQDHNYNRDLIFPSHLTPKYKYPWYWRKFFSIIKRFPMFGENTVKKVKISLIKKGFPFDQSSYDASCQIEVIIKKALLR